MEKYELSFILKPTSETEAESTISRVRDQLTELGVSITSEDDLGDRSFTRVANKKVTRGRFISFFGEIEGATADQLKTYFKLDDDVFRVRIIKDPTERAAPAAERA